MRHLLALVMTMSTSCGSNPSHHRPDARPSPRQTTAAEPVPPGPLAPVDAPTTHEPAPAPYTPVEDVQAAVPRNSIVDVIRRATQALSRCSERAVEQGHDLTSAREITFTVAADGRVTEAHVQAQDQSGLSACLEGVFLRLRFAPTADGQSVGGALSARRGLRRPVKG